MGKSGGGDYQEVIKFRHTLETEEARMLALNASLAIHCSPEVFRLIEIIGLEAALKLMLTLSGVSISIPSAVLLPESINLASAAIAVLKGKMGETDASIHYQVDVKELRKVHKELCEYYRARATKMSKIRKVALKGEIDLMFKRLSKGDVPFF